MTPVQIVATTTYERAARKLLAASERNAMERSIAADPLAAPVIPGSGGIRKLRWRGSGRGKRGGVRTIYFHYSEAATVYLLTIYAKADSEELRPGDLKAWARLVATIKKERRR
jgi:hypothetical protein